MNQEFVNNDRYEIQGENGWENFDGVVVTEDDDIQVLKIETVNSGWIECTENHKLYSLGKEILAKDIRVGVEIDTVNGYSKVTSISRHKTDIVYDIYNSDSHKVYTNQILNHQCDEFAFVEPSWKADEFWASNYPTISASKDSKIIIISCVVGDTYIYTDKGIRQVKDFVNFEQSGGYEVESYGVLGKDVVRNSNIMFNNGKTKTKKIITTNSHIEGSFEHKLWACKNGHIDWYKLSELKEGDYISLQYGMNVWGDDDYIGYSSPKRKNKQGYKLDVEYITEDWAYLFGLYISEGYADKYRLNIACGDDISFIFDKLNLVWSCRDDIHYNVNNLSLIELLKSVDFDITRKAKKKEIPTKLMSMSRKNTIAMIRGIFDGDGFSRKDKGTIGIGLSSKKLLDQIRYILMNLGMLGDYYAVESKPTEKVKVSSMQHRLHLDRSSSRKFYDIIGFGLQRKQDNENILGDVKESKADFVPNSKIFFEEHGIIKQVEKLTGSYVYNRGMNGSLSRALLVRIKSVIDDSFDPVVVRYFEDNISENIKWCKIREIIEDEQEVYDFSLPDSDDIWCHSVIYNGYIGHQTPNGLYNKFHEIYSKAEEGKNTFKHVRFDYRSVPGRDEEWAKEQMSNLGKVKFNQEFGCFSINTKININTIDGENPEQITIGDLYERLDRENSEI